MSINYWKPNGNVFVGDCMPYSKDGVFHVYYLWDFGHHNHPVVGSMGGHQWAHASSTDLIHWKQEGIALPLDFENGETSNCTGSFLDRPDGLYAFYSLRSRFLFGENLRIARSTDGGKTFQKWEMPQLEPPPDALGSFRDPCVFTDDAGLIHMFISAGGEESGKDHPARYGRLLHYTTTDLLHYDFVENLLNAWRIPECADRFHWGNYYYWTYNSYWETQYRYSTQPFGPWKCPEIQAPASRFCAVMKTASWKDDRRIGVGWIPSNINGRFDFGGKMVFREMVQHPDGTLGTKFVEEMIPGSFVRKVDDVKLDASLGMAQCNLERLPDMFRIDGTVEFTPGTQEFGLIVQDSHGDNRRFISFNPSARVAAVDLFTTIVKVDMNPREVKFRIVRSGSVIDVELDGNRTLVADGADSVDSFGFLYVQDGSAVFRNLKIYG